MEIEKKRYRGLSFLLQRNLVVICIWVIWLSAYPFVFYSALKSFFIIPLLISLILLGVIILLKGKLQYNNNHMVLFALIFIFWGGQILFRIDFSYISNLFQVFTVFIIYLSLYNFVNFEWFISFYVRFLVILSVLGAIAAVCVFVLNLEPLFSIVAHDGRQNSFFYLTFSNTYFPTFDRTIIRFSGLFDEPGTLAFYVAYALVLNKLVVKNKKNELGLLIFPIFTLSAAHIAVVAVYLLLFKIRSIKVVFVVVIISLFLFNALQQTKGTDLDRFYKLTIERFEQDDSGGLKGNNRAELVGGAMKYVQSNPIFGYGKTYFEEKSIFVGANILFVGALYGIIGYFLLFCFYWYSFVLCFNREYLFLDGIKCCLILGLVFLQRPDVSNVFQLSNLLLFMLCIYFAQKKSILATKNLILPK